MVMTEKKYTAYSLKNSTYGPVFTHNYSKLNVKSLSTVDHVNVIAFSKHILYVLSAMWHSTPTLMSVLQYKLTKCEYNFF